MVLEVTVQLYPQSLCWLDGWIEAGSLCCAQNPQELGHGNFWALNSLKNISSVPWVHLTAGTAH